MRERYLAEIRHCQREHEPGVLIGVRNICAYTKIGPHTLERLINQHDFPATRLPDGRWCTSKRLIDEWIIQRWKATKKGGETPAGAKTAVPSTS
jgi:hypothetical protein